MPGAIDVVPCSSVRLTSIAGPGWRAGISAGNAVCAAAMSAAFAGAVPAKLGLTTAPAADAVAWSCVAAGAAAPPTLAAAASASSRA